MLTSNKGFEEWGAVLGDEVIAAADVTLTIRDDDEAPDTVSLSVDVASVADDGCVSPMTATVSPASPEAFTVTLSAESRRRV